MNYARNIVGEVCVMAQSCGVLEPRGLRRYHCRIIMSDGRSMPLDELYPEVRPGVSTTEAA